MVLQIALQDHQVDGLTPSEIAKLLTEKFRLSTTRAAVSMALGKATTLVNRISNGSGFLYRIMGPGEEYLAHLDQSGDSAITAKPTKTKKKHTVKSTAMEPSTKGRQGPKEPLTKASVKVSGPKPQPKNGVSPKAAIVGLIESGFFSQPKTGPEVQAHLKNKRGLNFETSHLRMTMLRMLRDQQLERDENAEGQYEYKKPSA
jgi:hypothetical protein